MYTHIPRIRKTSKRMALPMNQGLSSVLLGFGTSHKDMIVVLALKVIVDLEFDGFGGWVCSKMKKLSQYTWKSLTF